MAFSGTTLMMKCTMPWDSRPILLLAGNGNGDGNSRTTSHQEYAPKTIRVDILHLTVLAERHCAQQDMYSLVQYMWLTMWRSCNRRGNDKITTGAGVDDPRTRLKRGTGGKSRNGWKE